MDGSTSHPRNRYNLRRLRGERILKKKEGNRLRQWKADYASFLKDANKHISIQKATEAIHSSFESDALLHLKVRLICPLSKKRIRIPVRYETCRHLQCFDLKSFLKMKTKRNFLHCPICNTEVSKELVGLRIDKLFQNILLQNGDSTEVEILRDGSFRARYPEIRLVTPKVIDDEEPYVPDSTSFADDVKPSLQVNDNTEQEIEETERMDHSTSSAYDEAPEICIRIAGRRRVKLENKFDRESENEPGIINGVTCNDEPDKEAVRNSSVIDPKIIDDDELHSPDVTMLKSRVKLESANFRPQAISVTSSSKDESEVLVLKMRKSETYRLSRANLIPALRYAGETITIDDEEDNEESDGHIVENK
ncbi:MIZ/SP-RING zinc finger domain-containing protein [Ditylenchus destructor]|uniref:MIZ/SP-RING zinc finger domain-containing protein n=1 Tax=Ditylenchus destructor TaxID=166010 RepID=A0AAD4QV97_9BILA|nr:MIZ/SP-RING zinc finger domain-containing protein [Ditylenchus destructor]